MSTHDLEEYLVRLESDKVTERKKYCTQLGTLLENTDEVNVLLSNLSTWKRLIRSLQACLRKDVYKLVADAKKKGASSSKVSSNSLAVDLLHQVINIAIKENLDVKITELVGYITGCMSENHMKTYCGEELLIILQKCVLSQPKYRGQLRNDNWSELYTLLKNLLTETPENSTFSNCFMLLMKWGPSSGLPSVALREDFDFITNFCQNVFSSSPRYLQEDTVEVALNFCEHMAKDNRIACCKFGEDVIISLSNLYELNSRPERLKELLVNFFLLQMILHHPNGVTQRHSLAYSNDWNRWKNMLKVMYRLVRQEIEQYFTRNVKNTSFFKIEKEGHYYLCDNFTTLFVQLSRQIFEYTDFEVTLVCDEFISLPKKQKIEIVLKTYLEYINETKSWLWIHLVNSLIKTYPNIIGPEDYILLLQILSSIPINHESNTIYYHNSCLVTLLQIENILDETYKETSIKLWKIIGESTMRALGLNQHKEITEKLLEELVIKQIINFEDLIQIYYSNVTTLSTQSIKTISSGLRYTNVNDLIKKEYIIKCVLREIDLKNYTYLSNTETADFLVRLTFKQYAYNKREPPHKKVIDKYHIIKCIYFKSLLDEDTLIPQKLEKCTRDTVSASADIDHDSIRLLINLLEKFVINGPETEEVLFSKIILLINISSHMLRHKIICENDYHNDFAIKKLVQNLFEKEAVAKLSLNPEKERELRRIIECVDILNILFSLDVEKMIIEELKQFIPMDLLRSLFAILNDLQSNPNLKSDACSNLVISIAQALSNFACISGNTLNEKQISILELFASPCWNWKLEADYVVVTVFLRTVKLSEPGILPNTVLDNILECFKQLAATRYNDKGEELLDIICGIYPHIFASTEENRMLSIRFLKPFYTNLKDDGPGVAVSLLNCFQTLCQLDPKNTISRLDNTEIIKFVPEFLKSDYQEVRFKAIDVLVTFFKDNTQCDISDIHLKEEIFFQVCEASNDVFDVSGKMSTERRCDETLFRTASVLLTFVELIDSCDDWVDESIYAMLKIAHLKKLESLAMQKAVSILNKRKFSGNTTNNLLNNYILSLLEKWFNDGYKFDSFNFELMNCSNKYEFCQKNFESCVHFLISTAQVDVTTLARHTKMDEKEIIQQTVSKIFCRIISLDLDQMTPNILHNNKLLNSYGIIIGHTLLKETLKDSLDQIIIGFIDYLTDEEYIKSELNASVIFFTKKLSITTVKKIFGFLETFLFENQPLIEVLTKLHLSKLENILLQLKSNVYTVIDFKGRLKNFHKYTFFVTFVTEYINRNSTWRYYFVRDIIYTLLNIIENCDNISKAALTFLFTFIKTILPDLSECFKEFFYDSINCLKNIYFTKTSTQSLCIEILNYILVTNITEFKDQLKQLGTFPDEDDFNQIKLMIETVDLGNDQTTLEDELNKFLNHKDMLSKDDSLIHLRKVLCNQKEELIELYDKLDNIRGFSEDCENSVLHRLICALAQLNNSVCQKVSFEAARCLGELGPANLQTLVLQPEKLMVETKYSPVEIALGSAISILTTYLIDCDINVIQKASKILYKILDTKQGRKIADTDNDFGLGPIQKKLIVPFFPLQSTLFVDTKINVETLLVKINDDDLWCPLNNNGYDKWIKNLVSAILIGFSTKSCFHYFTEICELKVDICEHLLPRLIDLLISKGDKLVIKMLSQKLNYFFSQHWKLTVQECSKNDCIVLNKKSVKCMLNIIDYLRLMKKSDTNTRSDYDLNLNYLQIAKAAEFCANYFSALYYSELWCQQKIEIIQETDPSCCEKRSTMIDYICETEDTELSEALHNILRTAYKSIGDTDALPGCGNVFLLQPKYRVEASKEVGKLDEVVKYYAKKNLQTGLFSKELRESIKNYGFYQIALSFPSFENKDYESLWRLSQWNFEEKKNLTGGNCVNYEEYEKYRFTSLKSLHDNNKHGFEESLKCQFLSVTNQLRNISLESSYNLYPILTNLQSLTEMEDFSSNIESTNLLNLLEKWNKQDQLIKRNNFQYVEPIITQRIVMLTDYLKVHENGELIKDYVVNLSLNFADFAKEEGHFKEGLTILENLKEISNLSDDYLAHIDILDAELSWSIGNTTIAMQLLNRLNKKENVSKRLQSLALKLKGQYMSETQSENRLTIISDYFIASVKLMASVERNAKDIQYVMDTYDKLALFADNEYQKIMEYMKSDFFQKKIVNMEQAKKTVTSIQNQRNKTTDERKAAAIHDRNSNIDDIEIRNTKEECNQFLKLALKYYILSLVHSDDKNIRMFRIIALLLENRKIIETIDAQLSKLPSYKFVITLPQLIPHLSEDKDFFNVKVYQIIEKCALEHPHHTLPLLLSLANAYEDRQFDKTSHVPKTDTRVTTAKKLLKKLKQKGLENLVNNLEQLSIALIELAYYKIDENVSDRKKDYEIAKSQKITKIRNFDVLVPTIILPVSVTQNYSNITGIVNYKSTYQIAGGVNKPKKILCRGTDGIWHSQLVKGKDDLRQDAVMQQVFTIMNDLLSYKKSTKHLRIRTYKIVPLSKRSGVLKWADNSMPIGAYLTGSEEFIGAHQKYRSTDKSPNSCRDAFKRGAGKSVEEKLKIYKDICKNFKPVLHHFFENFFVQPAVWYERKRAYIHSIATTSMCGYILGIGDRHTSNILIDKTTAEVIHIDFGIAFEQGKVLPTPETVPFRLTRDIVDGMGVSGVEGTFRRSCEKTMEVLRQNAQTIITILEVLLYDPLYAWTISSAEAKKRQTDSDNSICSSSDSSEEPVNFTAERTLLRLREKLQGTELGHPRSIEHQVGTLIQEAVDPTNLCKLFVGWQPYL